MIVISEIGSNWHTKDDLFKSIEASKQVGADIVKFQYFTAKELFNVDKMEKIDKYHVKLETLRELKKHADQNHIEFMVTAFSIDGYRDITGLVKRHKIASSESHYFDLVKHVFDSGLETILSTGGLTFSQVKYLCKEFEKSGNKKGLVLLYCDPSYPSSRSNEEISLGIQRLTQYGYDVGLSDHGLTTCRNAAINQCYMVEKHFNPFNYDDTPDAGHSLNLKEMEIFIKNCKGAPSPYNENQYKRRNLGSGWYRSI